MLASSFVIERHVYSSHRITVPSFCTFMQAQGLVGISPGRALQALRQSDGTCDDNLDELCQLLIAVPALKARMPMTAAFAKSNGLAAFLALALRSAQLIFPTELKAMSANNPKNLIFIFKPFVKKPYLAPIINSLSRVFKLVKS